ncbi:HNH endonuclease signature motif containing protein [Arthrobacter wenxiniae]|uniref:DUF222 domain-containing protein n=1 Tax=Arthrobacter wenxiniae TaxID=2713570 RepID=A0A7Y7II74_9MICC|nr:HNH endonuclease signature motif containing protein [Arthrobacter wenxiniae]NVM95959.1 DUF222 domain-containing protein [Arthrobacter wenxiniae]
MEEPVFNPGNGEFPATRDVAALIAALALPSIEPFGPDIPALAGLPPYTVHPAPDPEPASRVSVARAVQDSTVAALAEVKLLENRTAAVKAALVTRHLAAAAVEAAALALDAHQAGVAESCAVAEIAATLQVPEGTAKALANHAVELVQEHPDTLAALDAGMLSWRHACTIIDESRTLAETPAIQAADLAAFEARLLAAAPGTTGGGFACRARRLREGTHPETLTTRMRQAIAKRSMTVEPGKDGMAWLTLHLPAPAANGALVQCTRIARAQQGPGEHRTLGQLRADTAAILLLGQPLPATAADTGATATTAGNAGSPTGRRTGSGTAGAGGGTSRGAPGDRGGSANATGGGFSGTGGTASGDGQATENSQTAGSRPAGARFIGDQLAGTILDVYAPFGPAMLQGSGYIGTGLIDTLPDWAIVPRSPAIGPLTEHAAAAREKWETNPENIPLEGTIPLGGTACPAGPPAQPDPRTRHGRAPDGLVPDGLVPDGLVPDGRPRADGPTGSTTDCRAGSTLGAWITEPAAAVVDGGVDGMPEDPVQEYFTQLEATRNGTAVTEPPLPSAQVIVTVPALALLGITNEPAQLAGHGPIPEEIARKLLLNAGAFLRVLTDPLTNTPLAGLPPDRYRLRGAEKTLLRALHETCSFPNCTNPALDTETDHITPYSAGGHTTVENSLPECKRHHGYKHFRDDKDRHGRYRQDLDPDRRGIKLRGWKPCTTNDGRIAWTSPTGKYHPPKPRTTQPPAYPKWLKKRMANGPARRDNRVGTAPRIDLRRSPLESLIEYNSQPHPDNDN